MENKQTFVYHAHPLTNTLSKRILLVIQCSVFLGKTLLTSHIIIWPFYSTLPWKKFSRSMRLHRDPSSTHSRFSVGFRSGLWLDRSRMLIIIFWTHSFVDFDLYFGSLSCWGVTFLHLQLSKRDLQVLCQHRLVFGATHDSLHLDCSPRPSWNKLHSPCFTVGLVVFGWFRSFRRIMPRKFYLSLTRP